MIVPYLSGRSTTGMISAAAPARPPPAGADERARRTTAVAVAPHGARRAEYRQSGTHRPGHRRRRAGSARPWSTAVAKAGGRPYVLDRQPPADGVPWIECDLADTRAAEAATRQLAEQAGGLDGVVTAAGMDVPGRLADVPGETWDRIVAMNLLGHRRGGPRRAAAPGGARGAASSPSPPRWGQGGQRRHRVLRGEVRGGRLHPGACRRAGRVGRRSRC